MRELKSVLDAAGINYGGITEKSDLEALALISEANHNNAPLKNDDPKSCRICFDNTDCETMIGESF